MDTVPPNSNNPAGATYGNTRDNGTKFHQGIDFAAKVGTPVYAAHDGVITWPYVIEQPNRQGTDKYSEEYKKSGKDIDDAGNRIYIQFGDKTEGFWHLQAGNPVAINPRTGQIFKPGDTVYKGDIIGYTGMTGNAQQYGMPHLHYGVRDSVTKKWENPTEYINTTINADFSATTPCDD